MKSRTSQVRRARGSHSLVLVLFLVAGRSVAAPVSSRRTVTLDEALRTARATHPSARRAQAETAAAASRARQALAPLLPQVGASASYQRSTANYSSRPGSLPSSVPGSSPDPTLDSYDYYNASLSASQLLYDFGQTHGRRGAAVAQAQAQAHAERTALLDVDRNVRSAYFAARAARAMAEVSRETLANQERHLAQITAFVEVGTRPKIDLAQARTDVANARVDLIHAENGYETAKASLNQALGEDADTDYDVADETLPPVSGEDLDASTLYADALGARPEVFALDAQLTAGERSVRAARGSYGPKLAASASVTEAGPEMQNLTPNVYGGLTLSWDLFSGGLTLAQVDEARAALQSIQAQRDALHQQVRLEVTRTRLDVQAGQAVVAAAAEAVANARERLRLAEGRYEAGSGSVIELSDAQLGLTAAQAQAVRAEYDLATARAALLRALGR